MKKKRSKRKTGKRKTSEHRFIHGVFSNTAQGYGFVSDSKGIIPDVFIPPGGQKDAVSGDKVKVRLASLTSGKKGFRGKIVAIDEERRMDFLGTVTKEGGMLTAQLDAGGIAEKIVISNPEKTASDHRVLLRIERDTARSGIRKGWVVEDFGHMNDPSKDVDAVVRAYGYSETFPQSVQNEAEEAASRDIDRDERLDLTDMYTCTVDPETAKDFDDAISVTPLKKGWEIWIHIADVSYYVREGSALDREAEKRSTSVYLLDTVIPMLPEVLSNGACSLKPGEERAAKSVRAVIDTFGELKEYSVHRTFIRSDRRFSYPEVQKIIEGNTKDRDTKRIMDIFKASSLLRKNRISKGSVMLDIPEIIPVCDDSGNVDELITSRDNESHQLIEDCMLLANRCVADCMLQNGYNGVFRVHEKPDMKKQENLSDYLALFGYRLRPGFGRKDLVRIIEQTSHAKESYIINISILRSFKQAEYDLKNKGHFALGFKEYLHFTSPIRRYPDLLVHKELDRCHFHVGDGKGRQKKASLSKAVERCNENERKAMEAEQSLAGLKTLRYISSLPDDTVFDGVISSAEGDYVSIEIVEYMVYGRLYLDDIGGNFRFEKDTKAVFSHSLERLLGPGDDIRVRIKEIDLFKGTIDFSLAGGKGR